jgi:hypothetical protein
VTAREREALEPDRRVVYVLTQEDVQRLVDAQWQEIQDLRAALAAREEPEGEREALMAFVPRDPPPGMNAHATDFLDGYRAALAVREEPKVDWDRVRRTLDEAVATAGLRESAVRGHPEQRHRTMRLSDLVPPGTSVSDAVSMIEEGMGDDAYRGPSEDTERPTPAQIRESMDVGHAVLHEHYNGGEDELVEQMDDWLGEHRALLETRPEAVEAVQGVAHDLDLRGWPPVARPLIAAFCEAEKLTVETRPRADNPNAAPSLKESRVVGPWRDVEEER